MAGTWEKRPWIAFDLDGTLIDTMHGYADIAADVLSTRTSMPRDLARTRYLETSGHPFVEQSKVIVPEIDDQTRRDMVAEFEEAKLTVFRQARPTEGTLSVLDGLKRQGVSLVISSNNDQSCVDQIAESAPGLFELSLGYGLHGRKGAQHVEKFKAELGLDPGNATFVGDSLTDGQMARALGLDFVGLLGTFGSEDFQRVLPGSVLIRSLVELPRHVLR